MVLQPHKRIVRFADANEFVQLHLDRGRVTNSANTIRNVTMVVPVLRGLNSELRLAPHDSFVVLVVLVLRRTHLS